MPFMVMGPNELNVGFDPRPVFFFTSCLTVSGEVPFNWRQERGAEADDSVSGSSSKVEESNTVLREVRVPMGKLWDVDATRWERVAGIVTLERNYRDRKERMNFEFWTWTKKTLKRRG